MSKTNESKATVRFEDLGLSKEILKAISDIGYEKPSPIQAEAIPPLLTGNDILGQAQTGTGKTGAFALPLLTNIDPKKKVPQLLILAPTRELAIQVAEACQQYAKHISGVNVLPIYGGQSYTIQLKALKRGIQVIVGTPGRVMDHMRRKTLKLDTLKTLVLDEADEMLRMGFIDDVKWVLEHIPDTRQIALFSATMPKEIKRVADQHLNSPVHIKIASKEATADNIHQRYWIVRGTNKLDAITRILENEETDGVIVFVRTKNATTELADRLAARGLRSEALNGDIPQANREKIINRLKQGKLDILIATDVVARGLDVERISHVINYDVPHDTESYIHRIGRTGRAGRSGNAILFISPREKRLLFAIERATKKSIEPMDLPSVKDINENRVTRFKARILDTIQSKNIDMYSQIITELQQEHEVSSEQIAAALGFMTQGNTPLLLDPKKVKDIPKGGFSDNDRRDSRSGGRRESDRSTRRSPRPDSKPAPELQANPLREHPEIEMTRYRVSVGRDNQVKPGNIVGAIANEAEIDSQYIGDIEIRNTYSTVDLPGDMPKEIMQILKKAYVSGKKLELSEYKGGEDESSNGDYQSKPRRSGGGRGRDNRGGKRHEPRGRSDSKRRSGPKKRR